MRAVKSALFASLMISTCVVPFAAYAQMPPPAAPVAGKISNISVEGNERVESKTILTYLGLQNDSDFSQDQIDQGLKALFATGFFADVKLLRSGNTLIVRVVENPVISRIAFEGNERIETKDLEKEVELKPRSIYSREKLQNDVKRILDIYRKSGRFNATVEPKLIKQDQNRVDLVYEITEGPIANVQKISFIGNKAFTSKALSEVIRTEEERWYRFLSDNDRYDAERLQYDQELLRRYYAGEGYADFQVKSAHAEMSPNKDAFYITFVIDEGPLYKIGEVRVDSELKEKTPDFTPVIQTKKGKKYDAGKIDASIDGMTKELGDQGYAFVDIKSKLTRHPEEKIVDINYIIKPGPRVYVERINITGNVRTLDEVIRREFRLSEGDPYNSSKLQRSEQRLNNLGFFEKVDVKTEQGSAPDKTIINVDVKEKSTGEINIGAGYSTTDGVLADFGVKENNLLGRGQELKLRTTLAVRRKEVELGFTEPYFLDRELATGFDIYRTKQDFADESSYDIDIKGVNLRTAYSIQEKLRHSITYSLRENNVTDVRADASRFIKAQIGQNIISAVGETFSYDNRNSRLDPTKGYFMSLSQELAGLGGDSKYLKHEVKASYYYPLASKWVVSVLGSGGYMFGLGEDIHINDRFFLGGDDLRGFRNAGVGPRDTTTRDALGGNAYYSGTAELKFPLGFPEEVGLSGAAFTDFGSLWHDDDVGPEVFDQNKLRVSVGLGVLWTSPFGPIRVDFAHAVVKDDNDLTEDFRFSFGTRF